MNKTLSAGLRLCVLIALCGLLIYFGFIDFAVLWKILARPDILIVGAAGIFLSYTTSALRWWLILQSQRFAVPYLHILRLHTIGVFSSMFVPGGTASADAMRMLMLARTVPAGRAAAVMSVFADRFVAVFVLALAAAFLTFAQWSRFMVTPSDPMFWLGAAALALPPALIIGAFAAWFTTYAARNRAAADWSERSAMTRLIAKMADFFELALENRASIVLATGASVMTTGLLIGLIVVVSAVAVIPNLSSWDIAQAAALSQFANGIPISPSGIGVGEAAFNQICIWLTRGQAHYPYATIFLAYRIISILVACCGAMAFMNVRRLVSPLEASAYAVPQPQTRTQSPGPEPDPSRGVL